MNDSVAKILKFAERLAKTAFNVRHAGKLPKHLVDVLQLVEALCGNGQALQISNLPLHLSKLGGG